MGVTLPDFLMNNINLTGASNLKSVPQIHVLGAIGFRQIAQLKLIYGNLNAVQDQHQILHAVETLGNLCVGNCLPWIFMQDLAPAYYANSTRNLLAQNNVKVLDWPGNSPDCNPIENLWAEVVRRLPKTLPKDTNELWTRVQQAWRSIPQAIVQNVWARCTAVH